ncbi:TVP38/TMEM64 family protein [Cohnella zeiphila]|uniref:TVP38/TMEM64 family membrane protein n=1 Tax=Cohnella zeiphila TaxID=2761120 RepID=A0A7X0SL51_9BACL|nr:TVP38/TMEM64 family protein [Cohnella zeiphila]MBB6732013.1 TVP38/TMEM64 family protein [Cohnella zeiphila]
MRRSNLMKIAGAAAAVCLLLWVDFRYLKVTPETIRGWILSFGWIAPAVYVGLYVIRPFTLFPSSVLSLAGGLAFGTWKGMFLTVVGEIPGAVLSFWLARRIGAGLFRGAETDPRLRKLESAMARRGFPIVLALRLAPFVPFDLVSYAAGVARVPMRAYFMATLIGSLPGTFAYCFLGASLTHGNWKEIAVAAFVFAIAVAVPFLFRSRVEKQVEEEGPSIRRKTGQGAS